MRRIGLAAVGVAALTASSFGVMGAPAAHAATSHGCPSGDVCIYPSGSWNSDKPSLKYYTYGAHNLSNQLGTHRVFNNQTGGATVQTCTAYDGGGCGTAHKPGWYGDVNLTPINSVKLAASSGSGSGVGGSISKSEILTRMKDWYTRKPAYSQTTYIWDRGQTRKYRTDCSGFADMSLHLNSDLNTNGIASSSSFTKRYAITSGNRGSLKPSTVQTGDVFDDTSDGHDFVFASWNSNGTFNYYNFGGGSTGHAPPEYHTGAHMTDSTLGYENTNHYVIYRYKNVH
jgi:hypothetical protein